MIKTIVPFQELSYLLYNSYVYCLDSVKVFKKRASLLSLGVECKLLIKVRQRYVPMKKHTEFVFSNMYPRATAARAHLRFTRYSGIFARRQVEVSD